MSFNILIMKHQNMLKMNNMKACKHKWELEIVTKTEKEHISMSPKQGGPPTKLSLKVMHPNCPHKARNASTSRHHHSHVMREPTPKQ